MPNSPPPYSRSPESRLEEPPENPLPPPHAVPHSSTFLEHRTRTEPFNPHSPPIQDQSKKEKGLALEPLTMRCPSYDPREWRKVYETLFPKSLLSQTIPSDAIAQKNKNPSFAVIILSFHDEDKQLTFLKNMAQAMSLCLAPTRVLSAPTLEKENQWERVLHSSHLRLIIACDDGFYLQPKLMHFYREEPRQSKHFLNQIPLLLLSDLSLYLREPQLKPLLWRAICNEFTACRGHEDHEKKESNGYINSFNTQ